jgi:hypothetical protein
MILIVLNFRIQQLETLLLEVHVPREEYKYANAGRGAGRGGRALMAMRVRFCFR